MFYLEKTKTRRPIWTSSSPFFFMAVLPIFIYFFCLKISSSGSTVFVFSFFSLMGSPFTTMVKILSLFGFGETKRKMEEKDLGFFLNFLYFTTDNSLSSLSPPMASCSFHYHGKNSLFIWLLKNHKKIEEKD